MSGHWRPFLVWLCGCAGLVFVSAVGAAYIVDPFDSGRSPLIRKVGLRPQGPRTAGASRGRDPAFDAAVIGNSHVQLLSPERLNAITGFSFVQLSVPATGPKEQFVILDWFVRHHPRARAIVIGADALWCTRDPAMPNYKPFPFWLYSRHRLEYVRGLIRYHVLEEIPRRAFYLGSNDPARARPDGYWDYEADYMRLGYGDDPALRARLDRPPSFDLGVPSGQFPVAEKLKEVAAALRPELKMVIVFPPTYSAALPNAGSAAYEADRSCKAAIADALHGRPNAAVVDWRVDRPEAHAADLFFDQTHYRQPLAQLIESELAANLR